MYQNEKTISEKEIYKGRVVHLTCDEVELENGYKTLREVIHHPGGVCIVALDEDENVYFVKQFRYPFKTALMEIPAGKLEYGEDHLECGRVCLMGNSTFNVNWFSWVVISAVPPYFSAVS